MTRAERGLLPDEKIVYRTRLHWLVYAGPVLMILLVSAPCAAGIFWYRFRFAAAVRLILLAAALAPFAALLASGLVRGASEFVVTNLRVVIYLGVLSTRSFEIMLNKVESIGVVQGLIGRALGYGSIVVGGTGGSKEAFSSIQDPFEFRKMVEQQMEAAARRP